MKILKQESYSSSDMSYLDDWKARDPEAYNYEKKRLSASTSNRKAAQPYLQYWDKLLEPLAQAFADAGFMTEVTDPVNGNLVSIGPKYYKGVPEVSVWNQKSGPAFGGIHMYNKSINAEEVVERIQEIATKAGYEFKRTSNKYYAFFDIIGYRGDPKSFKLVKWKDWLAADPKTLPSAKELTTESKDTGVRKTYSQNESAYLYYITMPADEFVEAIGMTREELDEASGGTCKIVYIPTDDEGNDEGYGAVVGMENVDGEFASMGCQQDYTGLSKHEMFEYMAWGMDSDFLYDE